MPAFEETHQLVSVLRAQERYGFQKAGPVVDWMSGRVGEETLTLLCLAYCLLFEAVGRSWVNV